MFSPLQFGEWPDVIPRVRHTCSTGQLIDIALEGQYASLKMFLGIKTTGTSYKEDENHCLCAPL